MNRPAHFRRLLLLALAAGIPLAPAQRLLPEAPVVNFTLPNFNNAGFRTWLAKGDQARYVNQDQIDITGLNFTTFSGEAKSRVEMVFLAPTATLQPVQNVLRGAQSVRLIRDDMELTGEHWAYDHVRKKVSIDGHVRVVFQEQLTDILK